MERSPAYTGLLLSAVCLAFALLRITPSIALLVALELVAPTASLLVGLGYAPAVSVLRELLLQVRRLPLQPALESGIQTWKHLTGGDANQ